MTNEEAWIQLMSRNLGKLYGDRLPGRVTILKKRAIISKDHSELEFRIFADLSRMVTHDYD